LLASPFFFPFSFVRTRLNTGQRRQPQFPLEASPVGRRPDLFLYQWFGSSLRFFTLTICVREASALISGGFPQQEAPRPAPRLRNSPSRSYPARPLTPPPPPPSTPFVSRSFFLLDSPSPCHTRGRGFLFPSWARLQSVPFVFFSALVLYSRRCTFLLGPLVENSPPDHVPPSPACLAGQTPVFPPRVPRRGPGIAPFPLFERVFFHC